MNRNQSTNKKKIKFSICLKSCDFAGFVMRMYRQLDTELTDFGPGSKTGFEK